MAAPLLILLMSALGASAGGRATHVPARFLRPPSCARLDDGDGLQCPLGRSVHNGTCVYDVRLPESSPCRTRDTLLLTDLRRLDRDRPYVVVSCARDDVAAWNLSLANIALKDLRSAARLGIAPTLCAVNDTDEDASIEFKFRRAGLTGMRLNFVVFDASADFKIKVFGGEILRAAKHIAPGIWGLNQSAARFAGILELAYFVPFLTPVKTVLVEIAAAAKDGRRGLLAIQSAHFYFPGGLNPRVPAAAGRRLGGEDTPVIGCYTSASTAGRGAGAPPSVCPDGYERQGALCYPVCPPGYYGVGPVCWQSCPGGFSDTGTGCQKWASSYGKGCCCVHRPCCGNPFSGCFYDWSCDNGCCGSCRAGYSDTGCTCYSPPDYFIKSTTGRGAGTTMDCPPGTEYDAGLCYPACPAGWSGVGPLCWKENCPNPKFPTPCGVGVCTDNAYDCTQYSIDVGLSTAESVASAASDEDPTYNGFDGTSDGEGETLADKTIDSIKGAC